MKRALRIIQKVQVRVLTRLGRYQEALALLPAQVDTVPVGDFFEVGERANVLLGLEDRDGAGRWVARAYGCTRLRPRVDELARQL